MLNIGQLIWVSVRPLIRLVITAGCGFAITKADIFPPIAARGAGQIALNITLPSLMFSKIMSAFNSDNISALGPLVLVAMLYEVVGIVMAWIIKQFFWVPHRFRHGIIVAGGWGNYGDIPTSVVMSLTASAPFNGTSDQNLAVAYCAAFIFVFLITLFPCGAHRWIAMDFNGPEVTDDEVQEAMRLKRRRIFHTVSRPLSLLSKRISHPHKDLESAPGLREKSIIQEKLDEERVRSNKHVNFYIDDATTVVGGPSQVHSAAHTEFIPPRLASPTPTITHADTPHAEVDTELTVNPPMTGSLPPVNSPIPSLTRTHRFHSQFVTFLRSVSSPPSLAILIAFPLALIRPLKALFIAVDNSPIPNAPDGQPPLAFIMDAAQFIGAASVPLGLICLGSAMARLRMPKGGLEGWARLPVGAIGTLAVGKVLLMPVLGVLICQGLTNAGVIAKDDHVLRFVCIFFSCLPTATTQILLTQVYSGTGTAEHLSIFLIPQYILMFISMVVLTAYSLNLVF
ncbi:auxin efflux carrier [Neolentinus lepideus HHB14362 ss-1]|uniref:Auxin efflux carrier n=1 Tax=Neolentinus lepideus HHB14362 ss-1 TaxID=1314782 RepID=A0A165RVF3_9AGAM|nr:auxin efflux carrier [Neolentinus lepideus HHB14362 ss-1]